MVLIAGAAAAYANSAARAQGPGLSAPVTQGGSSFGALVKDALGSAGDALKAGEQQTLEAVAGKADLNQVVAAVSNADMALQAVVAVGDKVIQAYQSVMSMPM